MVRRRWDPQPKQPARVLVAATADQIPSDVLRRAVSLSEGTSVAVLSLARIHGYALGLPNPGLLPTRRELSEHTERVGRAVTVIERAGATGWGQVTAARNEARTIVRAAHARGARHVVLIAPLQPRWRRMVEGDLVRQVSRKLGAGVTVEAVTVS
jgi:K+-sensing histidine kinase KdpD